MARDAAAAAPVSAHRRFRLIGALAGISLFELRRRREHGLDVSWRLAFDVLRSPSAECWPRSPNRVYAQLRGDVAEAAPVI